MTEIKQFCSEKWAKAPPQGCYTADSLLYFILFYIISSTCLKFLLSRMAQPFIRFKELYLGLLFHTGLGRSEHLNEILIKKLHFVFTQIIFF